MFCSNAPIAHHLIQEFNQSFILWSKNKTKCIFFSFWSQNHIQAPGDTWWFLAIPGQTFESLVLPVRTFEPLLIPVRTFQQALEHGRLTLRHRWVPTRVWRYVPQETLQSHLRLHFVTVCTFSYRIDQGTSPSTGCSALCVWCCAGYWTQ